MTKKIEPGDIVPNSGGCVMSRQENECFANGKFGVSLEQAIMAIPYGWHICDVVHVAPQPFYIIER